MVARRWMFRPSDGQPIPMEGAIDPSLYQRLGDNILVVQSSDATTDGTEVADFYCDGVSDDAEINAAIGALPSRGGTIKLSDGRFNLTGSINLTPNKVVRIIGTGTLLVPAAGVTAILINQGIVTARGGLVQDIRIDGLSGASTVGVELRDTNNAVLENVQIENCTEAIVFHSFAAANFVEGTLLDNVALRGNGIGLHFKVTSGTGSFMQTLIRGLKCVVGGSGVGIQVDQLAILMRSSIRAQIWIDTGQTGFTSDGDVQQSRFELTFEGAGGATGNTAFALTANSQNSDLAFFELNFTGTIATQLSTGAKNMHYWKSSALLLQSAGTAVWSYRRQGDTTDRIRFEGLTTGGRITFGNGALLDTNIYRSAADILSSDDQFRPASLKVQLKAGTPVDGDIVGGATDGNFVADSTGSKLWVRLGGAWKSVAVA